MPESFGYSVQAVALRSLPKAEVHVHLEGCFEPATLEQWAGEAGVPMPRTRDNLLLRSCSGRHYGTVHSIRPLDFDDYPREAFMADLADEFEKDIRSCFDAGRGDSSTGFHGGPTVPEARSEWQRAQIIRRSH